MITKAVPRELTKYKLGSVGVREVRWGKSRIVGA